MDRLSAFLFNRLVSFSDKCILRKRKQDSLRSEEILHIEYGEESKTWYYQAVTRILSHIGPNPRAVWIYKCLRREFKDLDAILPVRTQERPQEWNDWIELMVMHMQHLAPIFFQGRMSIAESRKGEIIHRMLTILAKYLDQSEGLSFLRTMCKDGLIDMFTRYDRQGNPSSSAYYIHYLAEQKMKRAVDIIMVSDTMKDVNNQEEVGSPNHSSLHEEENDIPSPTPDLEPLFSLEEVTGQDLDEERFFHPL